MLRTGGSTPVADGRVEDRLTLLYVAHYRRLVRLAAQLTADLDGAEEVVQDAYVKVARRWRGLRDHERAEAYLRQAVVNLARSRVRHRAVMERHAPHSRDDGPDAASAETGAMAHLRARAVLDALAELPHRQREALVLRYYADLSEAQIAESMGISAGAVKSHASRGLAALRPMLADQP